jgi:hypothetical protein
MSANRMQEDRITDKYRKPNFTAEGESWSQGQQATAQTIEAFWPYAVRDLCERPARTTQSLGVTRLHFIQRPTTEHGK